VRADRPNFGPVSSARAATQHFNNTSAATIDTGRRSTRWITTVNDESRVHHMFESIERHTAIAIWIAALVAIAGVGAWSGVSITVGASMLWLAACVVPPAVTLVVWRGAPPPTVAEILYSVDRPD
jgi:hypothetical protein